MSPQKLFTPFLAIRLVLSIHSTAQAASQTALAPGPLGLAGLIAHYQIASSSNQRRSAPGEQSPEAAPASVVLSFELQFGPIDSERPPVTQWLHLHAVKASGAEFQMWLLCDRYPPAALPQALQSVRRYILQEASAEPLEFRDLSSGKAVLPIVGSWPNLLPRPWGNNVQASASTNDLPSEVTLLGQRYLLGYTEAKAPAAPAARILDLRSDALIGVPSNSRTLEDRRRFDGSDYPRARLTAADYNAMIDAGMNCFNADPEQRHWLERRPVYYWGGGVDDLAYPECLYRPNYLGPALFLDEPAVGTRDYVIRPRLKEDPLFAHALTPQLVLDAFREHFKQAKYSGAPTELLRSLGARPDVALGRMDFLQQNLFTWETMISTGLEQLSEGSGPPPAAIVFEPPGHVGTRRTLPEMDMVYGCQIPPTAPANLSSILYGLLRGAARLSGRDWGTSIYGAVDPADSPWLLTQAYDTGARFFLFWDNAGLACVPFAECLSLSRQLRDHIERCPARDLARLRRAGEVLVLFPAGYNLGHVHLGRGSLWGLPELNLERTNRFGITYRTVMHNLFAEVERCIRLGISYDLAWDEPGSDLSGYREIVHIREDGKVEIHSGGKRYLADGPRLPERPEGAPPRLAVVLSPPGGLAPLSIVATADLVEGSAPITYTARPNRSGVYENTRVLWELFGPRDEDYRVLGGEAVRAELRQDPQHVAFRFTLAMPGKYRLRAATVDTAGRSTVLWTNIVVAPLP